MFQFLSGSPLAFYSNRHSYFALIITTFILVLVGVSLGFYLEDNETIVAAILYGEFGLPGSDQYFTDAHFLMWPFMARLSNAVNWLPVYGVYYLFLTFLWVFALVNFSIKQFVSKDNITWFPLLLMLMLIVLLTADSIVYHHCIRISILMAFVAMLYSNNHSNTFSSRSYYFGFVLYIVALFVRTHAAPIILAMFSMYAILTGSNRVAIVKRFIPHYTISILFVCIYQLVGSEDSNMGKYIEANYEYAILEKRSLLPGALGTTLKDSVKYQALVNFFITDSAEFTKQYFEATVSTTPSYQATLSKENIIRAFTELGIKLKDLKVMVVPVILILLLGIVAGNTTKKKSIRLIVTLIVCAAVPTFLVLFLVDEMKIRFFAPFVAISSFLLLKEAMKLNGVSVGFKVMMLIVLTTAGYFKFQEVVAVSKQEKNLNNSRKQSAAAIKNYAADKKLIAFVHADIPLVSASLTREPGGYFTHIGYFDAGYLTYYSYIKQRFASMYGISPLNYKDIIELLRSNDNIYGYAVAERLELIKTYFKVIYGVNFTYTLLPQQPQLGLNGKIYKLKVE